MHQRSILPVAGAILLAVLSAACTQAAGMQRVSVGERLAYPGLPWYGATKRKYPNEYRVVVTPCPASMEVIFRYTAPSVRRPLLPRLGLGFRVVGW